MKKQTAFFCVCITIAISFCSCTSFLDNQYIPTMSYYAHTTFSYGFSEILRLDKYYYSGAVDFVNNTRYTQIKADSELKLAQDYVDHFTQLYNEYSDSTNEKFAFDPNALIKMNDYFALKTSEGEKEAEFTYGKYDKYTLYYLDFYNWELYVFTVDESLDKYVLFILVDNTYYSFDIEAYTPPEPITDPEYNQNVVPKYTLNKYTPSEFLNTYPDYFTYDWYSQF